jgi:hypothetical protein
MIFERSTGIFLPCILDDWDKEVTATHKHVQYLHAIPQYSKQIMDKERRLFKQVMDKERRLIQRTRNLRDTGETEIDSHHRMRNWSEYSAADYINSVSTKL